MPDFEFYSNPAQTLRMTLSQFTNEIGMAVHSSPRLVGAWVIAELSDVRVNGGHCYMELIEKNAGGQTVAKLRATVWQSTFNALRRKFYNETQRDISNGLKVLLRGNATHHSVYGLSFNVTDIDPSYTLGDMERLRQEILMKLTKEGVIGFNKSLEMPEAPQRIAIISAPGAAGYGDFINQLHSNEEGFIFYTHLFPAIMQGERTSASVMEALDFVESTIDLWDCVAIIRGGGATTDLNGFDDYNLAKRVATFALPVVVGIGHERDRTVLDEIAHTRMKTPTAVAAFFITSLRNSFGKAVSLMDAVVRNATDRINGEQRRIAGCASLIPALANARISSASALLEREMTRIPVLVNARFSKEKQKLEGMKAMVTSLYTAKSSFEKSRLNETASRLHFSSLNVLEKAKIKTDQLSSLIEVLSPSNTLKRGYSVTRVNGKAVTNVNELKKGDRLSTSLLNGTIESIVE